MTDNDPYEGTILPEMGDQQVTDLKLEINNLIWAHGPDSLTLKQAEDRACTILTCILKRPEQC